MQTVPAPPPTRVQPVVDVLHGVEIEDPYRWLEDADSEETRAWIEAQNAHTRSLLDAVPGRDEIHHRLKDLLSIGTIGAPEVRKGRYFYLRREGEQNQPVLLVREGMEGQDRVLVDPNAVGEDGLVALDWWYPSPDGRLLVYGCSANGDEWSTLRIMDVASGEVLPDRIERTRHASIAWLPDGSALYYSRFPAPGDVPAGEEHYHRKIYFHRLGDNPSSDAYVFGEGCDREQTPSVDISNDGRWLILSVHRGWESNDVYLLDRESAAARPVPLAVGVDALFAPQFAGDEIYIHTNYLAPRYRVCKAGPDDRGPDTWTEVIPENGDAVLESLTISSGGLVARFSRNAVSSLVSFDAEGNRHGDVPLPSLGTVTEVTGSWDEPDAFFAFESFTLAPTVYRITDRGGVEWNRVDSPVDSDAFEVRQEWYESKDGTRVSMFIVHRKDIDRSRPLPTLLTGYGGFNLPRPPAFSRTMLFWLEQGGVFALPNLRGGSEYGEEWHRAGMLQRKQNVFDDFISAAEYLISQGYTDRDKLCIFGRSNGGLLVGAALTQRPDLFRAVVCGVPLLDMLRYHLFLIARLWIPEYGSADDPEQFGYLHAYSPYHRVVAGARYPAVLLFAAESDSRVDPMHARKMAALLQSANSSEHPILLRIESRAGHGIGKPLAKLVEDETDLWTFVCAELGVTISG